MKRSLLLLAVVLLVLFTIGCGEEENVIVEIGDGGVSTEDLDAFATLYGRPLESITAAEERQELLDMAVEMEVFYQAALARGFDERPEVQAEIEEAIRKIVVQRFVVEDFGNYGYSDDELRAYYDEHRDGSLTPRIATVRHILVATEGEALPLVDRLNAGADFAALAMQYSADEGSAKDGGIIGEIESNSKMIPPQLVAGIFNAPVNTPIGPIQSEFGWHVLWVDTVRDGLPPQFEMVKQQIVEELLCPNDAIRAYYEEHKGEFNRPDSLRLRFILLPNEAAAAAIRDRAVAGEEFATLAANNSIDPYSREQGGLLTAVFRDMPVAIFGPPGAGNSDADSKAFTTAAFSLEMGTVSAPLQLSRGWAIITVEDSVPGFTSTWETARSLARQQYLLVRQSELEQEYYSSLETELGVYKNETALAEYLNPTATIPPTDE